MSDAETAQRAEPQVSSEPLIDRNSAGRREDCVRKGEAVPDFAEIVSTAQERSAERLEQLRKRAEAIAREQQRRWEDGIVMLNSQVRPLLERALQACVEEGIPAILEDNFSEKAGTPRLLFYCSAPPNDDDQQRIIRESVRMVTEADGKCIRAGTAKSFCTYTDDMRVCADVEDTVTTIFFAVLESYFQSCERGPGAQTGRMTD